MGHEHAKREVLKDSQQCGGATQNQVPECPKERERVGSSRWPHPTEEGGLPYEERKGVWNQQSGAEQGVELPLGKAPRDVFLLGDEEEETQSFGGAAYEGWGVDLQQNQFSTRPRRRGQERGRTEPGGVVGFLPFLAEDETDQPRRPAVGQVKSFFIQIPVNNTVYY